MNIEVDESWQGFIAAEVESGAFASEAEVVRAALELLQGEQRSREQLDTLLAEGEHSADFQQWDFKTFLREVHADDSRREAA